MFSKLMMKLTIDVHKVDDEVEVEVNKFLMLQLTHLLVVHNQHIYL